MISFTSRVVSDKKLVRKAKRKERKDSVKAYLAGSAIGGTVGLSGAGIGVALNKIGKLPADKVEILHNAAEKALEISGVADKGVSIEYLSATSKKGFWKSMLSSPMEQVRQGYNAGFAPPKTVFGHTVGNQIFMPKNDIAFSAFHEIGHSINFHNSKFWKTMQKMRMPVMALASLPMLYGAFSKKSVAKDGQELTKKQKANNFIRDNAGKLSFGLMLPMLAEEAMASIRGQKLANKLLDSSMAKGVLKGNALAYSTYILCACATAVGSYAAVKIKDKLVEKRLQKTMNA